MRYLSLTIFVVLALFTSLNSSAYTLGFGSGGAYFSWDSPQIYSSPQMVTNCYFDMLGRYVCDNYNSDIYDPFYVFPFDGYRKFYKHHHGYDHREHDFHLPKKHHGR